MEPGASVPTEWSHDVSEVLLSCTEISRRVCELGETISSDYASLNPLLIVVLKGSVFFATDLSRAINIPHELEFVKAKSYEGTKSTGRVHITGLESTTLRDRHLIIIEDIVDTGLTLKRLVSQLYEAGPASVKCCTFLLKNTHRRMDDTPVPDYIAFKIPDKFVIGYGLDFDQRFRHLPFVGIYKT